MNTQTADTKATRGRFANWAIGTSAGRAVVGLPLVFLAGAPIFWLGWYWAAGVLLAAVSFALGWACARRFWRKHGYVPKL